MIRSLEGLYLVYSSILSDEIIAQSILNLCFIEIYINIYI